MIPKRVDVKCPYCGTVNIVLPDDRVYPQVILCDIDQNGCDRYFAAKINFIPSIETFSLVEVKKEKP